MGGRFSFSKKERLSGGILIHKLFSEGKTMMVYPFRIIYLFTESDLPSPAQMLISVPKRNFKRAVDRNLLKRRIKEAYRLNKSILYDVLLKEEKKLVFAMVYISNEIVSYQQIELRIKEFLLKFSEKI